MRQQKICMRKPVSSHWSRRLMTRPAYPRISARSPNTMAAVKALINPPRQGERGREGQQRQREQRQERRVGR